jgi:hypothetical protein
MDDRRFNSHYEHLKHRWTTRHANLQKQLWKKHKTALEWIRDSSKNIVVGSLAGIFLLTQPTSTSIMAQNVLSRLEKHILEAPPMEKRDRLIVTLESMVPKTVEPLSTEQEINITKFLTEQFNFPVTAELESKRLNRNYGYIGAEQHLKRYPDDTMATHFETPEEQKYYSSGMAPGLGGWGYFNDSQQEKYYIAVPVFLSPGWRDDVMGNSKFFGFRKMLVVNPENGKTIIVVIGDAGPAESTGKHIGGSPEVMDYLERQDGRAKGPVLYFFIDDPQNQIPLGPITVK